MGVPSAPGANPPPPTRPLNIGNPPPQASAPPVRALSGGTEIADRTTSGNPLRRLPPGNGELIDPVSDVPRIAPLPAFAAVEARSIPRLDLDVSPRRAEDVQVVSHTPTMSSGTMSPGTISSGNVAFDTDQSASRINVLRISAPLSGDVGVLQTPASDIAARTLPEIQSAAHVRIASASSGQHGTASPEPTHVNAIVSNHHFTTATTPDVLQFATSAVAPTSPGATSPGETASVRPIQPSGTPQVTGGQIAGEVVRLPSIASETWEAPLMAANSSPLPSGSAIVPGDSAPSDPFPVLADITPPTPAPAFVTATSLPTIPDPFEVASGNDLSRVAEVAVRPLPLASQPPASSEPILATQNQPSVHQSPTLAQPVPLPVETPQIAETRPTPNIATPAVQESTGFASSRRAEQPAEVAGQEPGFARSRQ